MTHPLVSVWMITYNHEKYIRQALESVFSQITNFEFEVVIGEDCSTDSTREILKEFQQRYPESFVPIYHEVNIGHMRNAFDVYAQLKGKYVAALEGDDYWTDPHKLQKQVDVLEASPDVNLVFTNVLVLDDGNFKKYTSLNDRINSLSIQAQRDFILIMKDWAPMLTCMFRKDFTVADIIYPVKNFPGDFQIIFLSLRTGRIHWLNDVTGVYRVHAASMTRTLMQQDRKRLKLEVFKYKIRFAVRNKRWKTSYFLTMDYTRSVIRKSKFVSLARRVMRRLGNTLTSS